MLHIILLILKIIGIIILSILGLLLLTLLASLFVPVIYRIQGAKHGEEMHGGGKLFWLFISAKASIDNKDKSVKVKIRIFGIPLKVYQKIGSAIGKVCKSLAKIFKKVVSLFKREVKTTVEKDITIAKADVKDIVEQIKDEEVAKIEKSVEKSEANEEKTVQNYDENITKMEKRQEGLWDRIKAILIKIYYFPQQLYQKAQKIYLTISELCGKMKQWKEFLTGDTFKRALRFALENGKLMLKYVLPRKIIGNITYGFDDPAVTGQTLAVLSAITPLYKGKFKVVPMFNQEILEGDILMKGHVFGFPFVGIAWRAYRNKDVKEVIYHFSQKEA